MATGLVGQVDFFTGAARSAMPAAATRCGEVGFVTGAARLAMPTVATRRGGGVDLCTRVARSAMPEVATLLFGVVGCVGGVLEVVRVFDEKKNHRIPEISYSAVFNVIRA